MIRIYVQNRPLFLVTEIDENVSKYLQKPNTVFVNDLKTNSINDVLHKINEENTDAAVILHPKVDEVLKELKNHFTIIQAAGGLIYTKHDNDVLLIFRRGKWDLPKGKLDEGETLEACAEREIEEETGVAKLKFIQPLQITYHTYYDGDKHILKESHWFLLQAEEQSRAVPQTEEDIEECKWVSMADLSKFKSNMHASIIDVVNEGQKILNEKS